MANLATLNAPTELLPPGFGGGKKKKGKKGKKRGGADMILADDVNSEIWEKAGMVGFQKFYFKGKLAEIDEDKNVKDKGKEKQTLCAKAVLFGIVGSRMLARGSTLHTVARSVAAVGAVNLGNVL